MSMPEMPQMFDRLTSQVGEWAQKNPGPPEEFELSSGRELTGSDPDGLVTVTMKDFKVDRISFDSYWFNTQAPSAETLARHTAAAVNAVMTQYLREEILDVQAHAVPMDEVYAGLKELSADFRAAYTRAASRLPQGDVQ